MNTQPFSIIPHFLYDWALQQKNPERALAVIILLARRANWGTGTWKRDGVVTHKGEVRRSIREISRELKLPFYSVREIIKKLEEAGFIELVRSEHGKKGYVSIFKIKWHNINQPLAQNSINETEKINQQPNQVFNQSKNKKDKGKEEVINQKINQQPNQPLAKNQSTQTEIFNHRNIRSNIEEKEVIEEKEEKNIEADNKSADQKTENFEEKKEKLKEFREEVKKEIKESSESKEESSSKDEEDEPVTDAHIRASVERIKEAFKTEYVKRLNKPAYISVNSINKIFKDFKESYKTRKRLKEAETLLIEKIPDFFSLTDEWVRKKGYSFFAFSWRIGDLLSEPVKPKYCGSYTNKEFSLTEAMPW